MSTGTESLTPDTHRLIHDTNIKYTVLIVDDNPTNLGVLSNYLKGSGYRILVARNGESALQKAEYVQPDLILLDIMMPGINGFETCRRLKANESTKDIPVIFMTALSASKDKVHGFQVGAVDYVTKPLNHEEVLARVSAHLNIRGLTKDLQTQNVHLKQLAGQLQKVNATLSKQNIHLETSSEVGQQVTSILELDELLMEVVQLIQAKFGYYFIGVWLLDEQQQALMLQAQAGVNSTSLPTQLKIPLNQSDNAIVAVYHQAKAHLVEDVAAGSSTIYFEGLPKAQSELALPLRVGQDIIGVLDILSDQHASFIVGDQIVLQTLADQIAIAIRNAQRYNAEQRRRKMAESLEQTGRVLSSDLDLRQRPQRILEELSSVVPYTRGSVFLKWGDELQSVAMRGYPPERAIMEMHISIDDGGVFQRMAESGQPILIDDVTQDPGWQQLEWLPINHSWLGVPLIANARVIGMISLTRVEVEAFSDNDAQSVLAFAGQAAIALENAGLFDEISRFNEQLEQQVNLRTEELNNAYRTLERLDKTKTDFINVTSHELRTPLSVIKGYTQILEVLPDLNKNSEIGKMLAGIIQGVDRLHQIVDTMLDVVKIDTQVLQVRREPTALAALIEKVRRELDVALQDRRQSFIVIGLEDLPLIETNPDLIFKVLYNLIINAIKYTPNGGKITILGHRG